MEIVPLLPFSNLPLSSSTFTAMFDHQAGLSNEVHHEIEVL